MQTILAGFTRQCIAAIAVLVTLTVLLGGAYPAAVWAISRLDSHTAEGSQVSDRHGCPVGSSLIGIDPRPVPGQPDDPYLHARVLGSDDDPMATGDPAASAPSNKGPNNETLVEWITQRRKLIAAREGVDPEAVPPDAVTGSGSGLDPEISPEYAELQIPRLARVNHRTPEEIRSIIDDSTKGRDLGFLGEPRVNVLEVNLALGLVAPTCLS